MPEFLHEVVRQREWTVAMTDDWRLIEYTTPVPTDPWAAVEARNNEEHNVHYSGGPF
jgi:hypothetical protein